MHHSLSLSHSKPFVLASYIPHHLLNIVLAQNPILLPIVRLNDRHSHTLYPQEVPDPDNMTCQRMLPISQETAHPRLLTEGFWYQYDPEEFGVCGDDG